MFEKNQIYSVVEDFLGKEKYYSLKKIN